MLNENYKKRMQQLAGIDMFKGCEIDNNVVLFCENKITEVEFLNYINSNLLEEGVIDNVINFVKNKILNSLYSFISQAAKIGLSIIKKVISFFDGIINTVIKFKTQHPTVFKIIVITLMVGLILIVTTAEASASVMIKPKLATANPDLINTAIGWIQTNKQYMDSSSVHAAIDSLSKIQNMPQIGGTPEATSMTIFNDAIQNATNIMSKATEELSKGQTSTYFHMFTDFASKGAEFVKGIVK